MYSVLVYPNITFQRNLEADSYIVAVGAMIRALNSVRHDLEFTMLLPKHVESLDMPNVTQVEYALPRYPNQMRAHFDTQAFLKAIDWKRRSYDVVWSHLPEHTLQMKNVLYNVTNERPEFIGYCHWFELPENTYYSETMLEANLAGIRAMRECGVNSEWLRSLVVGKSTMYRSAEEAGMLFNRLRAQHLPHDPAPESLWRRSERPEGGLAPEGVQLIAFNHRDNAYTGFRRLLKLLDRVWETRQDWRLMTTTAVADRPYIVRAQAASREEYLRNLSQASFGIGAFEKYSAWSVSVMDGFSVGVPYLLPRRLCFPEMVGEDYGFFYDSDEQLEGMIYAMLSLGHKPLGSAARVQGIAARYAPLNVVSHYSDMFDRALSAIKPVTDRSKKYAEVQQLVRYNVGCEKAALTEALNWGRGIPWTPYRERLRRDGVQIQVDKYWDWTLPSAAAEMSKL